MLDVNDFSKKQILVYRPTVGDKISYSNDNIVIKSSDGNIKYQQTCFRIFMLLVIGDCTLTTGIIRRAKKFGFAICFMTISFRIYGILNAGMEGNTRLREKQYLYSDIAIGRHLIINKIDNQLRTLKKIRKKTPYDKEGISILEGYIYKLSNMERIERDELLSIEGNAAKVYFSRLFSNSGWNGRKPRIKVDYINALLDIGYTALFNLIDAILEVFGFDIYKGVLHTNFYMRKSLVCDIMEPFRPIIDWKIRTGINLGQFKQNDFIQIDNKWQLEYKNSSRYLAVFIEELVGYKEEIFIYIRTYYRNFMKDRNVSEYSFFYVDGEE